MDALWKAEAILTGAMVQFLGQTVGWRPEARYIGLNLEVKAKWETPGGIASTVRSADPQGQEVACARQ
ncbi:MAG: hypothetical protein ABSH53_01845 [Holophaga sp.]